MDTEVVYNLTIVNIVAENMGLHIFFLFIFIYLGQTPRMNCWVKGRSVYIFLRNLLSSVLLLHVFIGCPIYISSDRE